MKTELMVDGRSIRYNGITITTQEEDKKSTLTITREGIDLAVIVGNVDIESVELEGNTVLRIKD